MMSLPDFGVPVIERAIDFEEARSALANPNAADEDPLISLGAQRWGMALGTAIYGAILGVVFAAGVTVLRKLVPDWKPLAIAVTAAALGFWALSLSPFFRYPLNPRTRLGWASQTHSPTGRACKPCS